MLNALNAAVSGLTVASQRLLVSANNTANASTINYRPQQVTSVAAPLAGTLGTIQPREPAFVKAYQPSSLLADAEGFVNAPNVDLASEAVDGVMASVAYQVNAAVIKKVREMEESLQRALDTRA